MIRVDRLDAKVATDDNDSIRGVLSRTTLRRMRICPITHLIQSRGGEMVLRVLIHEQELDRDTDSLIDLLVAKTGAPTNFTKIVHKGRFTSVRARRIEPIMSLLTRENLENKV